MVGAEVNVHGVEDAIDDLVTIRQGWGTDSRWIVGVGAEYGAYVEFGTARMAAQPYLFPAVQKVMRSDFKRLENRANSMEDLVALVALAIESEAKRRAPVDTGFLRSSIEAAPAGAMRGRL